MKRAFNPIEILQAQDKTWFFRIRAKNGNILCSGLGYNRRLNAERGANAVIRVIQGLAK